MSRSLLQREFESGDTVLVRAVRWLVLAGGLAFLLMTALLPLAWPQQLLVGVLTVLMASYLHRRSSSYLITLTLILLSFFATLRYGYWRMATTRELIRTGGEHWFGVDALLVCVLLLAECYSFAVLAMGYVQTLWPLHRTPAPLPNDPEEWPVVDLLIPTYNEPLSLVRYTVLAAMNIDWPAEKLNIHLLDDGGREDFRAFAKETEIGYMTRAGNEHAKAGNINSALEKLHAPFVAIFDADHVPTRSFLQVTVGWFLRDRKLAVLQTPHHFYSSDPFERNLEQTRPVPNEGELFYGVVQDGNDFWNATFFSGSCAVLRRAALDEVGGIAVETVTEDAHTSLRMQMKGWNTAYINIPQAAGLATERMSDHVRQRVRWARGMVQILRTDNPLFARGLTLAQRLCYFNSIAYFLCALPRLIFLHAPLIYLLFGRVAIPGYWLAVAAYAFPHLALSSLTNSRIQGEHRRSFWNEIYETVLAPFILLPTLRALFSTKAGRFDVTAKGSLIQESFFDARMAQPFLIMLILNFAGVLAAIPRLIHVPFGPLATAYDGAHPGTIAMNVAWACFNIALLSIAASVAWESQQRRRAVRVTMSVLADVLLADGTVVLGVTADVSSGGASVTLEQPFSAKQGESIRFVFQVLDSTATLPATILSAEGLSLRAYFGPLTMQEEESLAMILYSRADSWLRRREPRERERPLHSLMTVLKLSGRGLSHLLPNMLGTRDSGRRGSGEARSASRVVAFLPLVFLGGAACQPLATAASERAGGPRLEARAETRAEDASRTNRAMPAATERTGWTIANPDAMQPLLTGGQARRRDEAAGVRGWPLASSRSPSPLLAPWHVFSSRGSNPVFPEDLHGDQRGSSRLCGSRLSVGQFSLPHRMQGVLSGFPWLVVLSNTMLCVLMAAVLRTMLGRRARVRLQGF